LLISSKTVADETSLEARSAAATVDRRSNGTAVSPRLDRPGSSVRSWSNLAAWQATESFKIGLVVILILCPALICLRFLRSETVNVPYADDWRVVVHMSKLYSGTLGVSELMAPVGEHYLLASYVVVLALGVLTNYNTTAALYLNWALIACMCALFYTYILSLTNDRRKALTYLLPIPWLLFSLRQWETLQIEAGLSPFLANFLVIASLVALNRSRGLDRSFACALVAGMAATWSFGNGMPVWAAGAVLLLVAAWANGAAAPGRRETILRLALWVGGGALVMVPYFQHFIELGGRRAGRLSGLAQAWDQRAELAEYFATAIGSALLNDKTGATIMGMLLIAILVVTVAATLVSRRQLLRRNLALCLTLHTLSCVAMLAFSRAGFGAGQAMSSRYSSIVLPGLVGLYLLAAPGLADRSPRAIRHQIFGVLLGLLAFGVAASYVSGHADGATNANGRRAVAYFLRTYEIQSDRNLLGVYPSAETVRTYGSFLKSRGMTLFGESVLDPRDLPVAVGATGQGIDSINGQPTANQALVRLSLQRDDTVTIVGWAVDEEARRPAGTVFLTVDDRLAIPTMYGADRPDIAARMNLPELRKVGYTATFGIQVFGPGLHTVRPEIVSADGGSVYRGGDFVVEVGG
jgi:hypothetical protein